MGLLSWAAADKRGIAQRCYPGWAMPRHRYRPFNAKQTCICTILGVPLVVQGARGGVRKVQISHRRPKPAVIRHSRRIVCIRRCWRLAVLYTHSNVAKNRVKIKTRTSRIARCGVREVDAQEVWGLASWPFLEVTTAPAACQACTNQSPP